MLSAYQLGAKVLALFYRYGYNILEMRRTRQPAEHPRLFQLFLSQFVDLSPQALLGKSALFKHRRAQPLSFALNRQQHVFRADVFLVVFPRHFVGDLDDLSYASTGFW